MPPHLPATGSPVLNAGDPAFAAPPDSDQRGQPRVAGGRLDMGAVERQAQELRRVFVDGFDGEG